MWRQHRGWSQSMDAWFSSCSLIQPMMEDSGICWLTSLVSALDHTPHYNTKFLLDDACTHAVFAIIKYQVIGKINFTLNKLTLHMDFKIKCTQYLFKCSLMTSCLQKSMASFQRNAFQSHTAQRPRAEWMTSLIIRCVYTLPSLQIIQAHIALSPTSDESVLTVVFFVLLRVTAERILP